MPKKYFKRLTPKAADIQSNASLKWLGPLMKDPNLFHLNRQSVSKAFLVGLFLAFFPLPGQMVLAVLVAFCVRCNLPIAVTLVWITNPFTIPPIFFMTYKLGALILDTPIAPALSAQLSFSWVWVQDELQRVWKPLLLGSVITGVFLSITGYYFVQISWRWYVGRQWMRRKAKRVILKQKKQDKSL